MVEEAPFDPDMADITKIKGIEEETKFMHERAFNVALLEVFIGDRTGTRQEREAIRKFRKKLGDKIYVESVYLLTHKLITQEKKAKQVFDEILCHQREVSAVLGRPVGVQVAALDYMQNIMSVLEKPLVMEEARSLKIAKKASSAREEFSNERAELKEASPIRGRRILQGVPVVIGFASGHVFRYQDILSRELEAHDIKETQIVRELQRLEAAIRRVEADLMRMKDAVKEQVDSDQAAIFDAHRVILRDLTLLTEIEEELRSERVNVEHAVKWVFRRWERKFKDSQNAEIQERSSDVADIGRRLLKQLLGIHGNALTKLPAGSIIFAKRLLPSDTVHLDRKNARGVVTEEGGPNSHVAILASAFHIPLISRIGIDLDRVPNRAPVIMDGASGKIVLRPLRGEMARFKEGRKKAEKHDAVLARRMSKLPLERGGRRFIVDANVASFEECQLAKKYGCDGVGLYRIEQIYMSSSVMPTEEFLFDCLKSALTVLKDKTVTLRLLDIGGDKTLPYIDLVERTNPALGVRGVRLLLKYPNLLQIQLRVFLRLSALFSLRILVPMVTLAQDMVQVRKVLDQEKDKLKETKVSFDDKIPLGAMIETPSSVLAIDPILRVCDFLSVGTNDLLQFVMAADRENMNVSDYYEAGNPLILRWVAEVAAKADQARKDCEVCGELAGYLEHTEEFLRAGVRHYSVVPHLVPRLKEKIYRLL
jgi:phosphoenolpyruvate-protein phosphotransferase